MNSIYFQIYSFISSFLYHSWNPFSQNRIFTTKHSANQNQCEQQTIQETLLKKRQIMKSKKYLINEFREKNSNI